MLSNARRVSPSVAGMGERARRRSGRLIAGIAGLVLALGAACTPAQPPAAQAGPTPVTAADPAWNRIVDAARQEGKLVIYGTFEQSLQDVYIPAFNKVYPFVAVEVVYGTGPQSAEKIRAEAAAGKLVADIWRSNTDPGLAMRDQGILEQWQAPSVVKERDRFAYQDTDEDEQGYLTNVAASVFGIMVNTRLLKPEDEPKSWFDLQQPRYRGQIIFSDPQRPSPGQSIAWFISQRTGKQGEDFLRALGGQDLQLETSSPKMAEQVARGERAISAPQSWTSYQAVEGPNVKFVQPKEGLYYSIVNTAIPKGAPHANAAKLWIEWEASRAGQQVKVDVGQETAIRNDVDAKHTWLRLDTAGPWASVTFEERRSKQAEMASTVRTYFTIP